MNPTDFIVTFILVSLVITGSFIFAGNVFTQANVTSSVSPQFEQMNQSSQFMINQSKEIYNESTQLQPMTSGTGDYIISLPQAFVSSLGIIASSLKVIPTLVFSIGDLFHIPDVLMAILMSAFTIIVVFMLYRAFRSGGKDI